MPAICLHFLLAAALTTQTAANPEPPDTSSQSALDHGLQAFKAGRYDAAVQHFKTAVAMDPASTQAHLYLGITYAYQVVPNLNTPENLATANLAIAALKQVPDTDSQFLPALRQIASVQRNTQQSDPAKTTELHILQLDPSDAEAHYTLGVLDWQESYRNAREALALNSLTDDGTGNPKLDRSSCLNLRNRNASLIQDGLDHLQRAIELRPNYDDAMQYLQLTYRRHADLACGDEAARIQDLTQVDQWTQKAMITRKLNEPAREAANQTVLSQP